MLTFIDSIFLCSLFTRYLNSQYLKIIISIIILISILAKPGLVTGLGLLELWHLIYPRVLTEFGMLVFFTNLSLMEFQVRHLALFLLFSVIDDVEWFWMESLQKNIQSSSRLYSWSCTFPTIH